MSARAAERHGAQAPVAGVAAVAGPGVSAQPRPPSPPRLRRPGALQVWRQQPVAARALLAAAAAALLAATLGAWALVPRWQAEADTLQTQAHAWRRAAQARAAAAPVVVVPVLSWRSALPVAAEADARLAALLASAQRQGVAVGRSQQQWQPVAPAPAGTMPRPALSALQLTMQADGSYAALRAWVAQALASDAHLALAGLRLQRSTPDAPVLRAELQWALLQQGDSPPAATAPPGPGAKP